MEGTNDVKPRLAEMASRLSAKEIPCIFCKKPWESRLTIINDKKDILGALDALNVPYEPIPGVTDYACYKCVYRINVIIDFRRLLQRNINKTRANYYYSQGNKDMCRKYLVANDINIANSANSITSECMNLLITDVRSEREPERTADFLFDCFNDPDMYSNHYTQEREENQTRLLEPMFETEFAEVGANRREKMYKNYNNLNANKYNYKCQFCAKTYKRMHYLKKHERKHRAQMLRRDSSRSSVSSQPAYACERCDRSFDTRALLRNHEKSHRNLLKCTYCPTEFVLPYDLEIHEAQCYGEVCARDEVTSGSTHYTRSRKRPRLSTPVTDHGDSDAHELESLYTERMRNVKKWMKNINSNSISDAASEQDDDTSSLSSRLSGFSAYSRPSTVISNTTYTDGSEDGSVVSFPVEKSKYNRKLQAAKSSVLGVRLKGVSAVRERDLELRKFSEFVNNLTQNEFNSSEWRTRRKQAKREHKALLEQGKILQPLYFCQANRCYYFDESIDDVMMHEMCIHRKLALFRCPECRLRFTRRNLLDIHKMDHCPRNYWCHLCNQSFVYHKELKHHQDLHSIRSHKCPYCRQSFLKHAELAKHLQESPHDNVPNVAMEHQKLLQKETGTNDRRKSKKSQCYRVYIRPQPKMFSSPKGKYECLSWKLGTELTHYTGVNQIEMRNDKESLFQHDDEDLLEHALASNGVERGAYFEQGSVGKMTHSVLNISLPSAGPTDLSEFDMFSIDAIPYGEDIDDSSDDNEVETENQITLSMKRDRKQWLSTFTSFPRGPDLILDPVLPSMSSLLADSDDDDECRI